MDNLIASFDLERVHKSGARFDPDKTKWFNHHYMQTQNDEILAEQFKQSHTELNNVDNAYIAMVVGLIKERANFTSDFWELSHYFFQAPSNYDDNALKKAVKDDTKSLLTDVISIINNVETDAPEAYQTEVKNWITEQNIGFGKVMMPLRISLVGALQGPDVFQIIFMIGKDETLKRIQAFINTI